MGPPTLFRKGSLRPPSSLDPSISKDIVENEQKALDDFQPIFYIIDHLKNKTKNYKTIEDRVLILKSGTGSGKSTAFPVETYKTFKDIPGIGDKTMICLQPSTLTATQIPMDTSKEPAYKDVLKFGQNIGYQIGELQKKPRKGILYATVGILYQQMLVMTDEELMKKYSFVMVDECHARSVDLDMLLLLLKKFLIRNWENPECFMVICMSATFDVFSYQKYFTFSDSANPPSIIIVEGQTYPVQTTFLEYDTESYIEECVNQIVKQHGILDTAEMNQFSDFLVFASGVSQINKIKKGVESKITDGSILVIPMDSARNKENGIEKYYLNADIKKLKNFKGEKYKRKLIISTNLAETGLTIDTLLAVFDLMFVNAGENIPIFNANMALNDKPIPLSSSRQRKGRAGRKAPGLYFPMCCEKTYNMLMENRHPDIYTQDFTMHLLKIIVAAHNKNEKFNIDDLDLLSKPSADSYYNSVDNLVKLNFIYTDLTPTKMGITAIKIRYMSIEDLRMVFAGYEENVSILELITIAAFLTVDGWNNTKSYENEMRKKKKDKDKGKGKDKDKDSIDKEFRKKESEKLLPVQIFDLNISKEPIYTEGGYKSDSDSGFDSDSGSDSDSDYEIPDFVEGNFEHTYEGGVEHSHYDNDAKNLAKINKILLGSDFIETIFIFEAFKKNIANADIAHWCFKNGLDYKNILEVIKMRDEFIEGFVTAGLPLNNTDEKISNSLETKNLNYIQRMKKCIKAGYKNHSATWDHGLNSYVDDNKKIKIRIESELAKVKPNNIYFNKKSINAIAMGDPKNSIKQYFINTKLISF